MSQVQRAVTRSSYHFLGDSYENRNRPPPLVTSLSTSDSEGPGSPPMNPIPPPSQSPRGAPQDPKMCVPPSPIHDRSLHQQARRGLVLTWKWEIFTWSLGTCAFTAIVVLLLTFKDQPLHSWKSTVQVTTTVATLSQIAQSALLVPVSYCIGQLKWEWFGYSRPSIDIDRFDLASRGPDGSARLLYHLAWRPHLVSLGALVTVLLLTFSSFVQQSVQINIKILNYDQSTKAQIPRITTLPTNIHGGYTDYSAYITRARPVDMQLSAAIKSGLLSPSVSLADVVGRCDTGRCTWEPYRTLALCSYTEDISPSILPNTTNPYADSGLLPIIDTFNSEGFSPPSIPDLGPMFPTGMSSRNAFISKSSGVHLFPGTLYENKNYWYTSNNSNSNLPDIAQTYLLYYDPCEDIGEGITRYNPYGWKAFKGRLRMCIQTLQSEYNTTMKTEVVASEVDITWEQTEDNGKWPIWCARLKGDAERFCFSRDRIDILPIQLNSVFNVTMSIYGIDGSHEVSYSTDWGPVLVEAVLGPLVQECNRDPGLGFDGFTRIISNVGNSISNS